MSSICRCLAQLCRLPIVEREPLCCLVEPGTRRQKSGSDGNKHPVSSMLLDVASHGSAFYEADAKNVNHCPKVLIDIVDYIKSYLRVWNLSEVILSCMAVEGLSTSPRRLWSSPGGRAAPSPRYSLP